jgi:hypothetical protein
MLTVPEQLNKTFETQLSLRNIQVHQRSYLYNMVAVLPGFLRKVPIGREF